MAYIPIICAALLLVLAIWLILNKQERCFRRYEKKIMDLFLAYSQDLQKVNRELADKMQAHYCGLKNALGTPEVLAEHLNRSLEKQFNNIIMKLQMNNVNNASRFANIIKRADTVECQIDQLNTVVANIQEPVQRMVEIQTKQVIKYGESNRNLYLKLQKKGEELSVLQKTLQEMTKVLQIKEEELKRIKGSVSECLAIFVDEIDFMRKWMEDKGIPVALLEKDLNQYFKNIVPSVEYHKNQNDKELRKAINPTQNHPGKDINQEVAND